MSTFVNSIGSLRRYKNGFHLQFHLLVIRGAAVPLKWELMRTNRLLWSGAHWRINKVCHSPGGGVTASLLPVCSLWPRVLVINVLSLPLCVCWHRYIWARVLIIVVLLWGYMEPSSYCLRILCFFPYMISFKKHQDSCVFTFSNLVQCPLHPKLYLPL